MIALFHEVFLIMVSHQYRCIFIHIPKTAGQSVERVFLDLHGLNWATRSPLLLSHNASNEIGPERLAHLKAADYVRYSYLSQDLFDSYFKFSIVRNPWERVVSVYRYHDYEGMIRFDSFVDLLPEFLAEGDDFLRPQSDFLFDHGKLLVDFVARFETLEKDFSHICKVLKLGGLKLPHVNRTKSTSSFRRRIRSIKKHPKLLRHLSLKKVRSKNYLDYYTPKSLQKVGKIYAKDIRRFGYNPADLRAGKKY